jgi:hypothetical protein
MNIYYAFEKTTGLFMGSGTPYYDNDEIGCTETAVPQEFYEHMNLPENSSSSEGIKFPFWENNEWVLKPVYWNNGTWSILENNSLINSVDTSIDNNIL